MWFGSSLKGEKPRGLDAAPVMRNNSTIGSTVEKPKKPRTKKEKQRAKKEACQKKKKEKEELKRALSGSGVQDQKHDKHQDIHHNQHHHDQHHHDQHHHDQHHRDQHHHDEHQTKHSPNRRLHDLQEYWEEPMEFQRRKQKTYSNHDDPIIQAKIRSMEQEPVNGHPMNPEVREVGVKKKRCTFLGLCSVNDVEDETPDPIREAKLRSVADEPANRPPPRPVERNVRKNSSATPFYSDFTRPEDIRHNNQHDPIHVVKVQSREREPANGHNMSTFKQHENTDAKDKKKKSKMTSFLSSFSQPYQPTDRDVMWQEIYEQRADEAMRRVRAQPVSESGRPYIAGGSWG